MTRPNAQTEQGAVLSRDEMAALAAACVDASAAVRLGSDAIVAMVKQAAPIGETAGSALKLVAVSHLAAQLSTEVFRAVVLIVLRPGEAVTAEGAAALRAAAVEMISAMSTAVKWRVSLGELDDDAGKRCVVADTALASALGHVGMTANVVRQ